jgi:hypothetical protein
MLFAQGLKIALSAHAPSLGSYKILRWAKDKTEKAKCISPQEHLFSTSTHTFPSYLQ